MDKNNPTIQLALKVYDELFGQRYTFVDNTTCRTREESVRQRVKKVKQKKRKEKENTAKKMK